MQGAVGMHYLSRSFGSRRVALAGLLAIGLCGAVQAAAPVASNGLGQAWPQAKNASAAPGWKVYVFVSSGVKYIQINDNAGTVHAVVATSNGQFLVPPMGVDAQRVSTPQQPLAVVSTNTAPAVTVYSDGAVKITSSSQTDGTTVWTVSSTPKATPIQQMESCPECGGNMY